ncbi:hypothetical protein SBRCBS47491_006034 [Sporothrix bragantina]|uniref:Pentatricopeptide repeat protein n=1 Tax=Sporothrix bragantina TaxID=671064 RepID=A0ABP0C1Z1_9PEZI
MPASMGLPWRRLRASLFAGRTAADLTPAKRAYICWRCAAKTSAVAQPVLRHTGGRLSRGLEVSSRLYSTAASATSAHDTVVSWTAIAKEEEDRRQRELEVELLGPDARPSTTPAVDAPPPTQGDILITSFAREPLVPRPANLSVLVTPLVKYDNYREANRSKILHRKSVIRQARLEAIRQAQLKPLPDWRAVLQRLVGKASRQGDNFGLNTGSGNSVGTILSAMSMSSPPPRRSGGTTAASSLAQLYAPDPLKEHLLQQLPPDASANEYQRNAMSFALPDNSPSVEDLLHGVDETLWAIAERTGCVLRLYRRGSGEADVTADGMASDIRNEQGQERGYRPWLLTLSGTVPSVYRAADEVTSFAKDALPVTIGSDVLLEDNFRRNLDSRTFIPEQTHSLPKPSQPQLEAGTTSVSTWGLVSSSYYLRDRKRRDDPVFSPHTIQIGAHQIPRPDDWTPASLERYVAALTNGRPPAHLAARLYPQSRARAKKQADGSSDSEPPLESLATNFDTPTASSKADGNPILNSHDRTVVNLLHSLFHEEAAKHALSMSAFKMALQFMCKHGETYRPEVRSLFERAGSVHMPMDTETFNILLASQVKTQDLRNFGATLVLMNRRGMKPDLTTWLLFMRLFESEEVKRHILRTMHASRRDLLDLPGALRSIAQELVEYDARRAVFQHKQFQRKHEEEQQKPKPDQQDEPKMKPAMKEQEHSASIFIDEFIGRQTKRYGPGWLSRTATNRILEVFGSYGLFPECLALLAVLRQQQLQQSHIEAYREQQHVLGQKQEQQQQQQQQQQQIPPEHDQSHLLAPIEDTNTIDTISYNIILTHAKLHNSLPKAIAIVRHMEGLDSNSIEPPTSNSNQAAIVHAEDAAEPLPPTSSPGSPSPVVVSVAPDGTTLQMLFEMAHQRRLPHLLGALWAYASVTRKITHYMRKRAGNILTTDEPPNKTPLRRALLIGQPHIGEAGLAQPVQTAIIASERIARRYEGWEPSVPLSQIMQKALDRDKMLLRDRLDRGGRSNENRPLPPPLRIPLRQKLDIRRKHEKRSIRTREHAVAFIAVQSDWMLPTQAASDRTEAEEAAKEVTTGCSEAVTA